MPRSFFTHILSLNLTLVRSRYSSVSTYSRGGEARAGVGTRGFAQDPVSPRRGHPEKHRTVGPPLRLRQCSACTTSAERPCSSCFRSSLPLCLSLKIPTQLAPGRLSQSSVRLLTSAQVAISRFVSSSPASGSLLIAQKLLEILSLPLSLPLPCACGLSHSLSKINKLEREKRKQHRRCPQAACKMPPPVYGMLSYRSGWAVVKCACSLTEPAAQTCPEWVFKDHAARAILRKPF